MTRSVLATTRSLVAFALLVSSLSQVASGNSNDTEVSTSIEEPSNTTVPNYHNATKWPSYPCSYGNTTLKHGETVLELPGCCIRLVCCFGAIVKNNMVTAGHKHNDTDLCKLEENRDDIWDDAVTTGVRLHDHNHLYRNCCVWGGRMYPSGHILKIFCLRMLCHEGHWDFEGTIDPACGHCWLHDDPHLTTFDGYHYDWHGNCNYSLAQTDDSYEPHTAVYASFQKCFMAKRGRGLPSCLDLTTFRENPHTVIQLNAENPCNITVNGEDVEIPDTHDFKRVTTSHGLHPVLALKVNECAVLIGASGFVVMQCRNRLDVWAHQSLSGGVNGLCGRFNKNDTDDFRTRQGDYVTYNTTLFSLSWLADNTTLRECLTKDPDRNNDARCTKPTDSFVQLCDKNTRGNAYLRETCQFDLCKLSQVPGNNKRKFKIWLKVLAHNAFLTEWINNATRDYVLWE